MQAANASGGGDSNARYTLSRDEPLTKVSTPNTGLPSPGPSSLLSSSLGLGTDASLDQLAREWQDGQAGGGKSAAPTQVPLWQVRPTARKSSTGDDSIARSRRQAQAQTDAKALAESQMAPIAQAKAAYLDMSAKDRQKLKDMLIAAGEFDPTKETDADVMNKWAHWVEQAVAYNTGRDRSQWISPWEAITKLGPLKAAGQGAGIDGSGYPHPIDQTETTQQTFTLGQIQGAAEQVLMATLKRGAKPEELKRYLDALNQYAKDHPIVKTTKGTATGPDQSNVTVTQTGGVDSNEANAMMTNMARQDPYYAETQAATTYFDAVMQALNSPINM